MYFITQLFAYASFLTLLQFFPAPLSLSITHFCFQAPYRQTKAFFFFSSFHPLNIFLPYSFTISASLYVTISANIIIVYIRTNKKMEVIIFALTFLLIAYLLFVQYAYEQFLHAHL